MTTLLGSDGSVTVGSDIETLIKEMKRKQMQGVINVLQWARDKGLMNTKESNEDLAEQFLSGK